MPACANMDDCIKKTKISHFIKEKHKDSELQQVLSVYMKMSLQHAVRRAGHSGPLLRRVPGPFPHTERACYTLLFSFLNTRNEKTRWG